MNLPPFLNTRVTFAILSWDGDVQDSKIAFSMWARGTHIVVTPNSLTDIASCPTEGLFLSDLIAMQMSSSASGFKKNGSLFRGMFGVSGRIGLST